MSIASILRTQKPRQLTSEEEKLKRELFEKINPRRRKFIERIGYENWDPFPEPNEPNDIRTDISKRTVQQLIQDPQARPRLPEQTISVIGLTSSHGVEILRIGFLSAHDRPPFFYSISHIYDAFFISF